MPADAASRTADDVGEMSGQPHPVFHLAWQVGVALTICAGIFHLLNLVEAGRWTLGPVLLTPFRVAFFLTWFFLAADFLINRRRLRIDGADALVAAVAALFLLRGLFVAETFGIAANWVFTGAGVFFLVKLGIQTRKDACLIIFTIVGAVLAVCIFGLLEYALKQNPLFDAIQVAAIGDDVRIEASDQFYRVRSLIGHPGYAGAILLISAPLAVLVFRQRRLLLAASLLLMSAAIILTFSRGTWILAVVVVLPLLLYYGRGWFKRNLKWLAPLLAVIVAVIVFDYWNREEVSLSMQDNMKSDGLRLVDGLDGPYEHVDDNGVHPLNSYLYFDVEDDFNQGDDSPVTVVIHFFDAGKGGLKIEYDSRDKVEGDGAGETEEIYKPSAWITKNDTKQWTSAAFYLEDPAFRGRQRGADFRIVDNESLITVGYVSIQKGRLKLPSVIAEHWISRWGSFATRLDFFPFTWNRLREHPLGVGLFNTPGTGHHAIDSLPLTWMIEFGWPGMLLLVGIAWLAISEGIRVYRSRRGPLTMLYLALILVLLHGAHLMIIYDKPSLVLTAAIAAVYAAARPWGAGGPAIDLRAGDCAA